LKSSFGCSIIRLCSIILPSTIELTFERFCSRYSLYDATVDDWNCILHLAHDWKFAEVVQLAIRELEKMTMSVVERIALYQQYGVSEDLLIPHYAALCARGYPLDYPESDQLGMATAVLINQAMHAVPKSWLQGVDGNSSPVDPKSSAVISKIIAHIGSGDKQAGGAVDTVQGVDGNSSPGDTKSSAVISKIVAHIGSGDKQAGGAADTV
jgi:hypothetical protein